MASIYNKEEYFLECCHTVLKETTQQKHSVSLAASFCWCFTMRIFGPTTADIISDA